MKNKSSKVIFLILFLILSPLIIFFQQCSVLVSSGFQPGGGTPQSDVAGSNQTPAIVEIERGGVNFDMNRRGDIFAANGDLSSPYRVTVWCSNTADPSTYSSKILSDGVPSMFAVVKVRGDGKMAVVLSRMWPDKNNAAGRFYKLWMVDSDCNVVGTPREFLGDNEFHSITMDSNGRFVVGIEFPSEKKIDLYFYDENGNQVSQFRESRPVENNFNGAFNLNVNDDGKVLLTNQGTSSQAIHFRRYQIDGTKIDSDWIEIPNSRDHSASFYSHAAGVSPTGDFVIIWTDYSDSKINASFFNSSAVFIRNVVIDDTFDSEPYETFRLYQRLFQIRSHSGLFFIPSDWTGGGFSTLPSSVSLYTYQGDLVKNLTFPTDLRAVDTREIEINDAKQIFVRTSSEILWKQESW
jgi:hypothetical protein